MKQPVFWQKENNEKDIVYTQKATARQIINFLKPTGLCLDPCKGGGSFFDYLPIGSEYCEIEEGKDFLLYTKKVNWVIGNPPYSIFEDFLRKSFEISTNVSYLVPLNKIFQRKKIMQMVNDYGGIKSIIVYGSGSTIGFPFGFAVANFHFKKGFKGRTKIILRSK